MGVVSVQREGALTRVTLSRPEKLNAFNDEMVEELQAAVRTAEADGTRLLVFAGKGKGFSGGFDLGGLEDLSDGDLLLRFVRVEQLLQTVAHARLATLALAHGPCYGAAADLVAACQWRVGSENARFRMPGSRFGIVLGTARLAQLVGADAARALLLRDAPVAAAEALSAGFLTQIAEPDTWGEREAAVLASVQALTPESYTALSARQRIDTRAADMAELVRSASEGSVKERIQAYLEEVAAARKGR